MRGPVLIVGAAVAAGCAAAPGGAHVGAALPAPEAPGQLLERASAAIWRGDPRAAEAALAEAAERAAGRHDPALDFWSELFALLRCDPLRDLPRPLRGPANAWEELRRLVQIERVRLSRRLGEGQRARPALEAETDYTAPAPAGSVAWPAEDEQWPDEELRPLALPDRCAAGVDDQALASGAARAPELALVEEVTVRLREEHPARPLLLLDQAVLLIARGRDGDAARPLALLEETHDVTAAVLAPAEQATLAAVTALAAVAAEPAGPRAIARLRLALERADLPRSARRHLTLQLAESLRAARRGDEATALVGPPPHGDDPAGRALALGQAEAHARAGRRAELLAEARAALAGQLFAEVEADGRLAALLDLAVRALLQSPVAAETFETLEALGVPGERLRRVEHFAAVADREKVPAAALAAFLWMAEQDRNPSRKLHHLARAAVAAARAGDHAEFVRLLGVVAGDGEEAGTRAAEPPGRRGATGAVAAAGTAPAARPVPAWRGRAGRRTTDWLRALLVVARDSLEALVEAGDGKGLGLLVDVLQRHLVEGGRGSLDDELTVVYRAARSHLDAGPRAYAERVGQPRRPILLGEIALGAPLPGAARGTRWVPPEPGTLVFVPRSGTDPSAANLLRWPEPLGVAWGRGAP